MNVNSRQVLLCARFVMGDFGQLEGPTLEQCGPIIQLLSQVVQEVGIVAPRLHTYNACLQQLKALKEFVVDWNRNPVGRGRALTALSQALQDKLPLVILIALDHNARHGCCAHVRGGGSC